MVMGFEPFWTEKWVQILKIVSEIGEVCLFGSEIGYSFYLLFWLKKEKLSRFRSKSWVQKIAYFGLKTTKICKRNIYILV